MGFRKFRLTGGEPTLRPDIVEIVTRLARLPGVARPRDDHERHPAAAAGGPLREAGLRRLNIHVDTLDPERLKS